MPLDVLSLISTIKPLSSIIPKSSPVFIFIHRQEGKIIRCSEKRREMEEKKRESNVFCSRSQQAAKL